MFIDLLVGLHLKASDKLEEQWMNVNGRNLLVVRVRACSDAHIALTFSRGQTAIMASEITLGYNKNDYTILRKVFCGDINVLKHTPNILSCNEYHSFWLHWASNTISVGYGAYVGYGEILSYTDNTLHSIQYIGLIGLQSADVSFEVFHITGTQCLIIHNRKE